MKEKLYENIEKNKNEYIKMSDFIFDNPELGLKEYKSSKLLSDFLKKEGFKVELDLAGFKTAFRAIYEQGKNGPSIGLLCEYDALEGLGHACAHHLQGPCILAAAKALKDELKNESFKIVVYGTPAEETLGAKVGMIKAGCFKDIDLALMMHGAPTTTTDVRSLALSNFEVVFKGRSAHAALAPWEGRSALDGVLLLCQGLEFLREHVKDDVRMHYTILDAGGPANVVPKYAKAAFSLRAYSRVDLDAVIERFEKIVKGAALMSECEAEIILKKALNNKIPVLSLNELLMKNAKAIKAPTIRPPREKTGSSDFGTLMYELPGSCIRVAFVKEGSSSHSEEFIKAGKSKEAHKALLIGAKILAASALDIIKDESILRNIKEEFKENKKSLKLA